jgi:hypothetical protein
VTDAHQNDSTNVAPTRKWGLGWHWIWFLPVGGLVLLFTERHLIGLTVFAARLAWQRWTWGSLISASADLCWGILAASLLLPISLLAFSGICVASRKPWYHAALAIVAVLLLPFATDFLVWGSFPFIFDGEGVARLRMIPFLPWPAGHYLEL